MGFYSGGVCHPTVQAAAGSACAGYPIASTSGPSAVVVACDGVAVDGSALILSTSVVGGVQSQRTAVPVSFATCDEAAPVADGVQLFGLALLALVCIWSLKSFVMRFFIPT